VGRGPDGDVVVRARPTPPGAPSLESASTLARRGPG
jgi:hypothetical protein